MGWESGEALADEIRSRSNFHPDSLHWFFSMQQKKNNFTEGSNPSLPFTEKLICRIDGQDSFVTVHLSLPYESE